jgi:hypothetical protein
MQCLFLARTRHEEAGRARLLCAGASDIDLFRDRQCVVNLNAEISHRALYLDAAQQQLDGTEIARTTINEGSLGSTEWVRAEEAWIQSDVREPFRR